LCAFLVEVGTMTDKINTGIACWRVSFAFTDGVNQNLTQDFAKAIYNDTPELKTAEITGRKGDMQINPDGTKTITGGLTE
jgi:hypothetical protein